ncbi:MAG TPA: AAA family ATPase [Candidatus Aphodovivens avistercoris]|nr:AAA family ATPase [Candidatus Aphodovivens avistercoris]
MGKTKKVRTGKAPSRKKLLRYFSEVSEKMGDAGPQAVPGKNCYADGQAFYSLHWCFRSCLKDDLNRDDSSRFSPVLAAYLSDDDPEIFDPEPVEDGTSTLVRGKLDRLFPQSKYPLNNYQIEAVLKALSYPVSIIKGPPGTGKTETILRIVALALDRGETVAVVSTNGAAVKNVEEKVEEALSFYGKVSRREAEGIVRRDLAFAAAFKHASLGGKKVREGACDPFTGANLAFDAGTHHFADGTTMTGWEKNKSFAEFTAKFPFITSTIHSLKKCFRDGDEAKYDLLIMDEASQTNLVTGVVALSCARRIVLVGDEEQLPPVVSDEDCAAARRTSDELGLFRSEGKEAADSSPYDMAREGFSFLESCYEVFCRRNSRLRTMLTEHYRCHPAIIGFCNEAVYGGELEVKTHVDAAAPACPIRILWYEGDYRERIARLAPREEEPDKKSRATCVNRKQMAIMREEEGPRLRRYVQEGRSICILSPFNGQIGLLQTLVRGLVGDIVDEGAIELETDGEEGRSPSDPNRVYALTIHKSQGQEFDVVYLLPVEDGNWEWPWSQGRRLVNVAASRAKQELRVVLSTKLMSADTQEWLTGRQAYVKKPARDADDPGDQEMFVRKLVDYTRRFVGGLPQSTDDGALADGFGFHRSIIRSVFDEIPFLQNPRKKNSDFAPERCVEQALGAMALPGLAWAKNVSFDQLLFRAVGSKDAAAPETALSDLVGKWYESPDEAHFDFVVFEAETRRVVLAIEVDGAWHRFKRKKGRFDDSQIRADDRKDLVVRDVCAATLAWLGFIRDGSLYRGSASFARAVAEASAEGAAAGAAGEGRKPLRLQTGWDDWAHFAREVRPASTFTFLRIPSDGSTFWEVDALRAEAKRRGVADGLGSGFAPPTIEDYIRAQRRAFKAGVAASLRVALAVEARAFSDDGALSAAPPGAAGGFLSISASLREWQKDPRLAPLLQGVDSAEMNRALLEAGYQRLEGGDASQRVPTELGRQVGMDVRCGKDGEKGYRYPVYSAQAREHLAARMGEILGARRVRDAR